MSRSGLSWPAPAKLNLLLRITGRRPDGYHALQTVFQFIEFGDELWYTPRSDGRIVRATPVEGVAEAFDLTLRAAQRLQATAGISQGVEIDLDKRIPLGGGLGGGSSDAATTLVALNHLWDAGLSVDELAELGLQLGADVPVFIRGFAAWAEGVGELLEPVDLPQPWYAVVTPGFSVSTATVFADPRLTRDSTPITIADFLSGDGGNDCVSVVRRQYPEIARVLDWLDGYGSANLTGTGSSVFAAFERQEVAQAVLEELPDEWTGVVARGLNRSPLLDRLGGGVCEPP